MLSPRSSKYALVVSPIAKILVDSACKNDVGRYFIAKPADDGEKKASQLKEDSLIASRVVLIFCRMSSRAEVE